MAKELLKGDIGDFGVGYEVKIEDGKLEIQASVDLTKLVDKAGQAIPGDSPIEKIVLDLAKQAVKSI